MRSILLIGRMYFEQTSTHVIGSAQVQNNANLLSTIFFFLADSHFQVELYKVPDREGWVHPEALLAQRRAAEL